MGVRKRLSDKEAYYLGKDLNVKEAGRDKALYRISKKQWEEIRILRATPNERNFVETIRKLDKNGEVVSTVEKLQSEPIEVPDNFEVVKISTSKTTGQQWIQYQPRKEDIEQKVKEIDFDKIVSKYVTNNVKYTPSTTPIKSTSLFQRLVYTDVHIGMTPNENGHSLYGGKWDEEELKESLDAMVEDTLENQDSDVLLIDELGDFMDGWDGETVRKGHHLPQNMDNEKAFDLGLWFKLELIDRLAPHYKKIVCHNICNDNHAGSFGYVVNSAFKSIVEVKYSHVTVVNVRKFIHHYIYGNNCFIITHGKDGKNLKFGFKPILDTKQIEKIKNYIDEHCLLREGLKIEFSKGDSHQFIFDFSTSDTFDYCNYPAFSPSSEWVQTNFKKGTRGFVSWNYKSNGQKSINPYWFDWKKGREEKTIDFSKSA